MALNWRCLGVVLAIEFPPTIKQMFDKLSVLALNIKSILQINCFGDLTFCETRCVRAKQIQS